MTDIFELKSQNSDTECNVKSNTIFTGDNLHVMRGIESNSIDLIATDPPFNSKRIFEAPIGSPAEGASFKDIWNFDDLDEQFIVELRERAASKKDKQALQVWNLARMILATGDKSLASYILYMYERTVEMHRVLKSTGSLYLHCDQTAGHYLKLMLDIIFGKENFRDNLIWHYTKMGNPKKIFKRNHDDILFYTKTDDYTFNFQTTDEPSIFYERHKDKVKDNCLYYGDVKDTKDTLLQNKMKPIIKRAGGSMKDTDVVLDFSNPENFKKIDSVWMDIPPSKQSH